MFENELLSWIIIAAVLLSLVLSAITLILQILRYRTSKPKVAVKSKTKSRTGPPTETTKEPAGVQRPHQAPPLWKPPAAPVSHSDHTEPLYSSRQPAPQRLFASAGGDTEQMRGNGYQIYVQETSPDGGRDYEIIVNGEYPVGRSASTGMQINHPTVSSLHCVLIAGPDAVFVSNRSNSNITKLNGMPVEDTRPLKAGDTLALGDVRLILADIRKNAAY